MVRIHYPASGFSKAPIDAKRERRIAQRSRPGRRARSRAVPDGSPETRAGPLSKRSYPPFWRSLARKMRLMLPKAPKTFAAGFVGPLYGATNVETIAGQVMGGNGYGWTGLPSLGARRYLGGALLSYSPCHPIHRCAVVLVSVIRGVPRFRWDRLQQRSNWYRDQLWRIRYSML
jgi:hypothetical protein